MKKVIEITGEELDALVREGHDILHAIIDRENTPRSTAIKKTWKLSEEERKRLSNMDITRVYQLWYSKAFGKSMGSDPMEVITQTPTQSRRLYHKGLVLC